MKEILLNIEPKEKRLAFLKDGQLNDIIIERKSSEPMTGNIYLGKVTNILHNIQSAFIDIGEGENGFIHISDILENTQKFQEMFDMDFDLKLDKDKKKTKQEETDITKILKTGQTVLVQVVKEPIGSKGARLTSNVSIAGRYLVLVPNTSHRGVSKKIQDRHERDRLKKTINAFELPQDMGLICRTASIDVSTEKLIEETRELLDEWSVIIEKFEKATKPTCLFHESNLAKKALLDAVDKKYDRLLIDDFSVYKTCKRLFDKNYSESPLKLEMYRDLTPMFERFNIENEIEKALRRKIWLPSGGYLYFDRTEAMYTIDVNSGRSAKKNVGTNVEESLVKINMEAAKEIARQLRIRNIGGLIICDFIDMRFRKNQRRVLEFLKEAMKDDSAKCTVLGMSEFGLIEMTRQRNRESLHQTLFTMCPYCSGKGMIKNFESSSIEIERVLKSLILRKSQFALQLVSHPELDKYLDADSKDHLCAIATKHNAHLEYHTDDNLHLNEFEFHSTTSKKKIEF